jgi:DNA-directed RNA polymerase subunit RPC12/RpoP
MLELDVEYVCLQCGRRAAEERPHPVITSLDDDDEFSNVA